MQGAYQMLGQVALDAGYVKRSDSDEHITVSQIRALIEDAEGNNNE